MTDTSPESVERLSPYAVDGGCDAYGEMESDGVGDYVKYEDYEALSARVAELEVQRNEALNQLDSALYSVEVLERRVSTAKAGTAFSIGTVHVNLKGAGYSHVSDNGGKKIAVTYEGDKVLIGSDGLITLDNVYVLGPVAVEEMKSAAQDDALRNAIKKIKADAYYWQDEVEKVSTDYIKNIYDSKALACNECITLIEDLFEKDTTT